VRQLIMLDRHITLQMLSVELNVSKDTIRAIMRDELGKKKMCAKFVPHLLTPEQKTLRKDVAEMLLKWSRKTKAC
jgi:hypothetical protein